MYWHADANIIRSHDLQYQGRDCWVAIITEITALEQDLRQRNAQLQQFNAASPRGGI